MRTGYKVVAAGLVIVLGCSVAAFAPFGSSDPAESSQSSSQGAGQCATPDAPAQDAGATSEPSSDAEPASHGIVGSAAASEGDAGGKADGASGGQSADAATPTYADGVYRASSAGKVGQVPVTVTIEDGAITDIRVGQNSEVAAMAEKAQRYVIPQILELQTTEGVDTATGATLTSDAIIDAVAQALERASAAAE